MAKVKIEGIREVTVAATALKAVDRVTKNQVGRALRSAGPDIWNQSVVSRFTRTRMDSAVFRGTRVRASSTSIQLEAGTNPSIAADIAAAVEFGDPAKTYTTYKRQGHTVRRRTQEQLPGPIRKGRVVHPAFKVSIPRIASLYLATVVKTIHDAWEGK